MSCLCSWFASKDKPSWRDKSLRVQLITESASRPLSGFWRIDDDTIKGLMRSIRCGQVVIMQRSMTTQWDPLIQIIAAYGCLKAYSINFYFEFESRKRRTIKEDTNGKVKGTMCSCKTSKAPGQTKARKSQFLFFLTSAEVTWIYAEVLHFYVEPPHLNYTIWKIGEGYLYLFPFFSNGHLLQLDTH